MLAQPVITRAQTNFDTQQKANDRIQELSKLNHAPPREYVIGRGDVMSVEVFDVPELTREIRVSQTGTIGLPLLPTRLYVAGLTELQAQQKIAEVLEANGLVSHPQVMVFAKEKRSKPIAVVGAVAHPMVVQADRPISLIEVLAEAGGISQDAGDVVIITRAALSNPGSDTEPPEIGADEPLAAGNPSAPTVEVPAPDQGGARTEAHTQDPAAKPTGPVAATKPAEPVTTEAPPSNSQAATPPPVSGTQPPPNIISINLPELLERGDTQNNIALQTGDVVTIPHAGIVYALGSVNRPGGYLANNDRAQLSTLKVLALAGGTTRTAKRSEAVIIRRDADGHQHSIPVDLAKVVRQETEDVRLLPSDILYVPDSHAKAALIRAGEIFIAVATSVVIYRSGAY
jgi:polysaccharide export outer membrane protein